MTIDLHFVSVHKYGGVNLFNLYDNLKGLCKEKGLTPSGLCTKCGVSKTIVSRLKLDPDARLTTSTAKKFADYLGVPVERVMYGIHETKNAPSVSDEAMSIASAYEQLNNADRDAVLDLIQRLQEKYAPKKKIIPLLGQSLAAGSGEPDFGAGIEDYEVDADSPAEFACKVHGDSLEPYYHDGDIALALKRQPMIGEVGAWLVDGEYKLKQFVEDFYGNVYLFALNRSRKDTDQTLWHNEEHTLVCMGTLIMKKRPPLPEI